MILEKKWKIKLMRKTERKYIHQGSYSFQKILMIPYLIVLLNGFFLCEDTATLFSPFPLSFLSFSVRKPKSPWISIFIFLWSANKHFCFVTKPSFFSIGLPLPLFLSPLLFFCNSWCVFVLAVLHSLFDVVSRSPELQSLATLSVIGRPAVSLASIDSF